MRKEDLSVEKENLRTWKI